MQGRRRGDGGLVSELEPGDYMRMLNGEVWFRLPNGVLAHVHVRAGGWTATEEDDGTLTIDPSINVHPINGEGGWHGWLRRGVWREA